MYKLYYPTDSFSIELMKSIPKKVFSMLEQMELAIGDQGYREIENVQVFFDIDAENGVKIGTITVGGETPLKVEWEGPAAEATDLGGSDGRFLELGKNLNFFIEVEKLIYAPIEKKLKEYYDRITPQLDPEIVKAIYCGRSNESA